MYCSTCGNNIADHLNYCNNCGSRVEKNPLIISNSSSAGFSRALVFLCGFGFIGFIAVLKLLLDAGQRLDMPAIVLILLGYLAAFVLIAAMMIGHIWKTSGDIRIKQHQQDPEPDEKYVAPVSFRGVNTAQLEEPKEMPVSVTEHTTRTLENVPR